MFATTVTKATNMRLRMSGFNWLLLSPLHLQALRPTHGPGAPERWRPVLATRVAVAQKRRPVRWGVSSRAAARQQFLPFLKFLSFSYFFKNSCLSFSSFLFFLGVFGPFCWSWSFFIPSFSSFLDKDLECQSTSNNGKKIQK